MKTVVNFLHKYCYEFLLICLLQHLYGSLFFTDLVFYGTYIRLINLVLIYVSSINAILNIKNHITKWDNLIIGITLIINSTVLYFDKYYVLRDISFLFFLILTFYHVCRFLYEPNKIGLAIISSAIGGYLLIIEIFVRIFLIQHYFNTNSISNINFKFHTNTFIDITYFCTVTISSIGFGDYLPLNHNTKMITCLLGLIGQMYLVVVMGIMVSKFMETNKK